MHRCPPVLTVCLPGCWPLQLPILRGLLLKLNTVSCGRRSLAHYVPLRMNVEFHKMLALVVGSLAFMHVWAHFMNFAEAPKVRATGHRRSEIGRAHV